MDENSVRRLNIKTLYKVIGFDDKIVILLREGLTGTLKIFTLYPVFQEVMETGGVLFMVLGISNSFPKWYDIC